MFTDRNRCSPSWATNGPLKFLSNERMNPMHDSLKWEIFLFRNRNRFCHSLCLFVERREITSNILVQARCMGPSSTFIIHYYYWTLKILWQFTVLCICSQNVQKRMCERYCRSDEHLVAVFSLSTTSPSNTNGKWIRTWGFVNQIFFCKSLGGRVVCGWFTSRCSIVIYLRGDKCRCGGWHFEHFTFSSKNTNYFLLCPNIACSTTSVS